MINTGNGFSSLHPAICFLYFGLLIIFPMIFRNPVYLASILFSVILLNLLLDRGKELKKNSKFYLLMASVVIFLNPIFSSRGATILFYFRDRPVTLESIFYGFLLSLSLLSILLAFLAYNRVITPDRFLFLFSSTVPKAAFIITVTLRFIPLMRRRLQEVMFVQQAMGAFPLEKTKRQKAREAMEMLNILVTWSLEASLQTAASMRSRGYETGRRSSAVICSRGNRDLLWLLFMVVTGGSALLGFFTGYGHFEVYPHLDAMSPLITWHFVSFLLFLIIPIYIEGRELILWRIIRFKM